MLTQSPKLGIHDHWVRSAFERKQPRRLLLALVLLLVALTLVVVKDREFWFGPGESIEAESTATELLTQPVTAPSSTVKPVSTTNRPEPAAPAAPAKKQVAKAVAQPAAQAAVASPIVVTTNRATVPPLTVEVVTGDTHKTLRPGSNAVKVEIPNAAGPATNAAELQRMSPGMSNQPDSYPLLAQRARVEGSVILQALIGADGVIRDLRVLSGPAILAPAAQQAVRQWRFKPYLQNGQPVETKANITVSFTIKVSDNAGKIT